jgi:hypothetical protein
MGRDEKSRNSVVATSSHKMIPPRIDDDPMVGGAVFKNGMFAGKARRYAI